MVTLGLTGAGAFITYSYNQVLEESVGSMSSVAATDDPLELTIARLAHGQLCRHPEHGHCFQSTRLMIGWQKCAICQQHVTVMNFSSSILQCLSCKVVVHRQCVRQKKSWKDTEKCAANTDTEIMEASSFDKQDVVVCSPDKLQSTSSNTTTPTTTASTTIDNDLSPNNEPDEERSNTPSPPPLQQQQQEEEDQEQVPPSPPLDTLAPQKKEIVGVLAIETDDSEGSTDVLLHRDTDSRQNTPKSPLHVQFNKSFPKLAKALQDNVLLSFRRDDREENQAPLQPESVEQSKTKLDQQEAKSDMQPQKSSTDNNNNKEHDPTNHDLSEVSETEHSEGSSSNNNNNKLVDFIADRTLEAVRSSNVSVAAVAGGIAGGIAGLVLAGPAGAYIGFEGALGVVAAGIATGGLTGKQIELLERRLLLGEDGTRKVLLVRPTIQIDPIWDQFCWDARKSAPRAVNRTNDTDIIHSSDLELEEKVILLVNRVLNDKTTLAGHVYRKLIHVFTKRCAERQKLVLHNPSITELSPRGRRDDAHAVIKHVTAVLMEQRPELNNLMESTATAVEALVFGELYDYVFEEIVEDTCEADIDLWRKLTVFQNECGGQLDELNELVNPKAVQVLKRLTEAHSVVEKLNICVQFLDLVAQHFKDSPNHVGADALLQVTCQHLILMNNLVRCNAEIGFLDEFARDETLLRGREGYALVTLQSCLYLLSSCENFRTDIFENELPPALALNRRQES